MEVTGEGRRSETASTLRSLGRFPVSGAFYSNAVRAVILIFFSRNSVSVAIRPFLGSFVWVPVSIQVLNRHHSWIQPFVEGATNCI